jgi:hydroxyacylglutathione hydrolase
MEFIQIYDEGVSQYAYLIGSDKTREAIIIDPQRNIHEYLALAERKNLRIIAATETHIHADFLSGMQEFIANTPVQAYLSEHGKDQGWGYDWVKNQKNIKFIKDGDRITVGDIHLDIVHTPGHTPEHITFMVTEGDNTLPLGAVTGDFVFAGDLGRPDLLESAAKLEGEMKKGAATLFKTAQMFKNKPDSLMVWPGHGAGSACGKSLGNIPYSTWGYEKQTSPALQFDKEEDFTDFITSDQKEPPLYFARMKHHNNKGTKLLDDQKQFQVLSALEFSQKLTDSKDIQVIDTRTDRNAAMKSRVSGSFYASFPSLSTAVGSMVEDAEQQIILIVDEDNAGIARRRLQNIGYDNVTAFVTPKTLALYFEHYGTPEPIETTDFASINDDIQAGRLNIVDVRSASEYQEAHIDKAIHAPYTRLPEFTDQLPKNETLYVHCGSGARAAVATSHLAASGYKVILVNDSFANARSLSVQKTG